MQCHGRAWNARDTGPSPRLEVMHAKEGHVQVLRHETPREINVAMSGLEVMHAKGGDIQVQHHGKTRELTGMRSREGPRFTCSREVEGQMQEGASQLTQGSQATTTAPCTPILIYNTTFTNPHITMPTHARTSSSHASAMSEYLWSQSE